MPGEWGEGGGGEVARRIRSSWDLSRNRRCRDSVGKLDFLCTGEALSMGKNRGGGDIENVFLLSFFFSLALLFPALMPSNSLPSGGR